MRDVDMKSTFFINLGSTFPNGSYHFLEFGYIIIAENRADNLRPEIRRRTRQRGIGNNSPYALQPISHLPGVIRPTTYMSNIAAHYTLDRPGDCASVSLDSFKFESYFDLLQLQMALPPLDSKQNICSAYIQ